MLGKNSKLKKMKQQSNIVKNSVLLKNLTVTERYELLQLCHRRKYKSGEFIFYQNDPGSGIYFIEEGSVQLQVTEPKHNLVSGINSVSSDTYSITVDAPRDIGTISIGYETRRLSSAQCLTDCTLLGFFTPDFETLKKRNPQTAVKFLEATSSRIMKQLERSLQKITDTIDAKTAVSIQFESQYELTDETDS